MLSSLAPGGRLVALWAGAVGGAARTARVSGRGAKREPIGRRCHPPGGRWRGLLHQSDESGARREAGGARLRSPVLLGGRRWRARRAVGGAVGGAAAGRAAGRWRRINTAAGSARRSAMAASPVEVFGLPGEEVRPGTAPPLPASLLRRGRAAASSRGRAGRVFPQCGGFLRAHRGLARWRGGPAGLR